MTPEERKHAELAGTLIGERMIRERENAANLAKLRQLVEDADAKARDSQGVDCVFWHGFRDGLRRAINVLEGAG